MEVQNIKFISRVVGIEKLKGKFKPFEARRMLLKENGLFLADERIVPLLPKLLGVKWFEAKKCVSSVCPDLDYSLIFTRQPIPVCLKRKDLKGELERAISSTYMNQNKGTCTYVAQQHSQSCSEQFPSQVNQSWYSFAEAQSNTCEHRNGLARCCKKYLWRLGKYSGLPYQNKFEC